MSKTRDLLGGGCGLLSVGVLVLALATETHTHRIGCHCMLGKGSLRAIFLAPRSNTMFRSSIQDHLQTRLNHVLMSSSSETAETWDEVERLNAALELNKKLLGKEHEMTLACMNSYATKLRDVGQVAQAQSVLQELCDLARKKLDRGHTQRILALTNLADICVVGGEYSPLRLAEAARLKKEVLEIRSDINGSEHPETLAAAEQYKAILVKIADIEGGALDEGDFLRLGFEANSVGEVAQDYLDVCGRKASIADISNEGSIKAEKNEKDSSKLKKLAALLKTPFKKTWNRLKNLRKKSKHADNK